MKGRQGGSHILVEVEIEEIELRFPLKSQCDYCLWSTQHSGIELFLFLKSRTINS